MRATNRSLVVVLAAAALAAGCVSGDKLDSTLAPSAATPLLARYVAMGNSITAGIQSGGINDSTQRRTYPVLLARMAGVPFTFRSFGLGCTALYTAPLNANGKLTATIPGGCDLSAGFPGLVQNVAVPGENVADLTATGAQSGLGPFQNGAGPLNLFILGGLNEVQAMQAVQPTFVSLWAPNNDILFAVNAGDTTLAPTAATYLAAFNAAAAAVKAVPTLRGAALIGIVDVPRFAPILQPGAFFFAAYTANPLQFGGKSVDVSCAPFNQLGQANAFAGNLVSFHVVADPRVTSIKCTPDAPYVTTTSTAGAAGGNPEINTFETRIAQINAGIKATADANGWVYVDPNTFADQGGVSVLANPSLVKKCQGLATAATLAQFQQAVATTCPGDPANYFGTLVSLDATHPSTAFHQALASYLAAQINAKYQTTITTTAPASGTVLAR